MRRAFLRLPSPERADGGGCAERAVAVGCVGLVAGVIVTIILLAVLHSVRTGKGNVFGERDARADIGL